MTDQVTIEQRRMADLLNLHPERLDTWPMNLIDHLIWIKTHRPKDFYAEFVRCTKRW